MSKNNHQLGFNDSIWIVRKKLEFFKWENEVDYSSRILTCLEEGRANLIDKLMKLKAKNVNLKDSEAILKVELVKHVNAQKH